MQVGVLPVTAFVENAYFLVAEGTKEAVLIDPGGEAARILAAVKELGVSVRYILDTHGHIDHVGAVHKVRDATGAKYGIHANDVPMTQLAPASYTFRLIPDYEMPPLPDFLLKDGDEVTFGDVTVRVIETPGHTMGSTCLLAGGLLFAGDTLFQASVGRTDFPGSSQAALVKSITTKLFKLPDDVAVFPGHGVQTSIGEERESNPFVGKRGQLLRGLESE